MILGSYVISWLFHTFPCFVLKDFVQPTRRTAKEGLVDQRNFTALPLLCASQAGGVAPWALKYATRWIALPVAHVTTRCCHRSLFTIRIPWGFQWWRAQFLNVRLRWYNNFWSFVHCCWMHPWIQAHPCGQETCPKELLVFFSPRILRSPLVEQQTRDATFKDYFRSSMYTEQNVFRQMGWACSSLMVSPIVIDTCKDSSEGARRHIHTFNDRLVSPGSVVLR